MHHILWPTNALFLGAKRAISRVGTPLGAGGMDSRLTSWWGHAMLHIMLGHCHFSWTQVVRMLCLDIIKVEVWGRKECGR